MRKGLKKTPQALHMIQQAAHISAVGNRLNVKQVSHNFPAVAKGMSDMFTRKVTSCYQVIVNNYISSVRKMHR